MNTITVILFAVVYLFLLAVLVLMFGLNNIARAAGKEINQLDDLEAKHEKD